MPTELEELVEFLHHGNTQIRQVATHSLLPYSEKEQSIFKTSQLKPVKDLKLLVRDYAPIAKDSLTILVNISGDSEVLKALYEDEAFMETILARLVNPKEPNANELAMLLANMAKDNRIEKLLTLQRDTVPSLQTTSKLAIDQLMDVFVKGAGGSYNEKADYDYLAYVFADLAQFPSGTRYFTTLQPYDSLFPLSKLLPFLSHPSRIRRLGVASCLKNISFYIVTHPVLFSPPLLVLSYVLLPLASGADNYTSEETDELPEELQLLDDSVRRERDHLVLRTHLETLLLLTSTREGREIMRQQGVYYVIRECHLAVEDEEVREACERFVNVIMRDEEEGATEATAKMHALSVSEGTGKARAYSGDGGDKDARRLPAGGGGGVLVTQKRGDSDGEEDEDDQVTEISL